MCWREPLFCCCAIYSYTIYSCMYVPGGLYLKSDTTTALFFFFFFARLIFSASCFLFFLVRTPDFFFTWRYFLFVCLFVCLFVFVCFCLIVVFCCAAAVPRLRCSFQVGFCTFDSTVHHYNLKATLSQPQILVVPDHTDPFLPAPDDLLVNLSESRAVVMTLLDSLANVGALPVCMWLYIWYVIRRYQVYVFYVGTSLVGDKRVIRILVLNPKGHYVSEQLSPKIGILRIYIYILFMYTLLVYYCNVRTKRSSCFGAGWYVFL